MSQKPYYRDVWALGPSSNGYPGAFPRGLINMIRKKWWGKDRLWLFSGSYQDKSGITVDINPEAKPTHVADWLERNGHECVFSSEVDKYARAVYEYRWEKPEGDITKIKATDIPDHDILCGGFPCQSFSIAGKRKGFQDIRGTLFAEIVRIAKEKRPRLLFLENVKGLLSADNGRCFHTILLSLAELGYNIEWEVLNSKNFGVPQNRERVFIIGHLGNGSGQEVFPLRKINQNDSEQSTIYRRNIISRTLTANYGDVFGDGTKIKIIYKNGKEKNKNIASTLTGGAHSGGNHSDMDLILLKEISPYQGDKVHQKDGLMSALSAQGGNKLKGIGLQDGTKIRRLTPLECERLQGFPDSWTVIGIIDSKEVQISDTQRYKMMGNAVSVPVIEAISERFD